MPELNTWIEYLNLLNQYLSQCPINHSTTESMPIPFQTIKQAINTPRQLKPSFPSFFFFLLSRLLPHLLLLLLLLVIPPHVSHGSGSSLFGLACLPCYVSWWSNLSSCFEMVLYRWWLCFFGLYYCYYYWFGTCCLGCYNQLYLLGISVMGCLFWGSPWYSVALGLKNVDWFRNEKKFQFLPSEIL